MNLTGNITVPGDNTIFGVLYLTLAVLVILLNGIIVLVITKSQNLHLPTLWMIAFMAVWDFLVGVFILLFAVPSAFLNRFPYPENFMRVSVFTIGLINQQTIFNIDLVMFDRYLSVQFPLTYPRIAVARNYAILISLTLMVNLTSVLTCILTDTDVYFHHDVWLCLVLPSPGVVTLMGSISFISLTAIVIGGVLVFRDIKRSRKIFATTSVHSKSNLPRYPLGFPLMVITVAVLFVLSYFPFAIVIMFSITHGHGNIAVHRLAIFSILSNSIWNVFIYTGTYRPFREELTRIFCKSHYRRQRQMTMLRMFQKCHHDQSIINS